MVPVRGQLTDGALTPNEGLWVQADSHPATLHTQRDVESKKWLQAPLGSVLPALLVKYSGTHWGFFGARGTLG